MKMNDCIFPLLIDFEDIYMENGRFAVSNASGLCLEEFISKISMS